MSSRSIVLWMARLIRSMISRNRRRSSGARTLCFGSALCERDEPVGRPLAGWRGAALPAGGEWQSGQYPLIGAAHRRRPARAQAVRQREISILNPQRIVGKVGDDHWLVPI